MSFLLLLLLLLLLLFLLFNSLSVTVLGPLSLLNNHESWYTTLKTMAGRVFHCLTMTAIIVSMTMHIKIDRKKSRCLGKGQRGIPEERKEEEEEEEKEEE